jgi:hypothetical protein
LDQRERRAMDGTCELGSGLCSIGVRQRGD